MDFSWEAIEGENERLTRLRKRMAEWAPPSESSPGQAEAYVGTDVDEYDRRFRDAVADDLDLPQAIVVLGEAVSSNLPVSQKYELLVSWDRVLGLDLDRLARESWQPTSEMLALVRQRDEARTARDFDAADRLRDRLAAMGLEVMDTPEGTKVRPQR